MTRDEAIAILEVAKHMATSGRMYNQAINMAIEALTSAEALQGVWIMHIDDLFPEESTQECSNCHEHETIKIRSDNFCPNCGAKMDGERKEL